ncbi:MAG: M48 family metallopeptidase [Acidimicrobiales bacterium]
MTTIEPALQYPQISAQTFAHPADRAAAAAIRSIPMLDQAIKKLSEFQGERLARQLYLGTAVRLGEDQLPAVWAMQRQCANTLDISQCPKLYVTQHPFGNAMTVGTNEPVTLVLSGLVSSYPEDELRSVLAHEMGHVLADHVGLTTALVIVHNALSGVLASQPFSKIPLTALYYSLLEWSRAAELTADRASALVVADPRIPCRALMRIAGGPVGDLNLDAFIRQATEYEDEADPFARWSRFFREVKSTHPFPVRRVKELVNWVAAGDYDRIRSGDYVRRGQEPPPSAEFNRMFEHYRSRFSTIVDRAGSGIQTVVDKVSSWLGGSETTAAGQPYEDADADFADDGEDGES